MAIGTIKEIFGTKKKELLSYKTYAEALGKCNNEGYEDSQLCRVIAKKTVQYKEVLNRMPFNVNPIHCYLTLVIQQILLEKNAYQISVADFGGAGGAHYFETRRLLDKKISVLWNVIETQEMIKNATLFNLPDHELKFHSEISQVTADLIYLSSSIQYVPEPYQIINSILEQGYPYILFNRMMLNKTSEEDLIVVQTSRLSDNGPGALPIGEEDRDICYPHTTLSQKKFLKKLEPGYELVLQFDEATGNLNRENKDIVGGGFLFKKKEKVLS